MEIVEINGLSEPTEYGVVDDNFLPVDKDAQDLDRWMAEEDETDF